MVFDLDPEKSLPVLFKDFAEDLDAATSLRVPYWVLDQDAEDLIEPIWVTLNHFRGVCSELKIQLNTFQVGMVLVKDSNLAQSFPRVKEFDVSLELAEFDLNEVIEVFGE